MVWKFILFILCDDLMIYNPESQLENAYVKFFLSFVNFSATRNVIQSKEKLFHCKKKKCDNDWLNELSCREATLFFIRISYN